MFETILTTDHCKWLNTDHSLDLTRLFKNATLVIRPIFKFYSDGAEHKKFLIEAYPVFSYLILNTILMNYN